MSRARATPPRAGHRSPSPAPAPPPDGGRDASGRRLLLLTTSYPRWPGDPAGSFVAGSAQAFASAGWTVRVLAPADPEPPRRAGGGPAPAPDLPQVDVTRIPVGRRRRGGHLFYGAGAPENLLRDPRLLLQAPGFCAGLGARAWRLAPHADLVLAHWLLPCGLVGAYASRGRPCAAICHSGDLWLLERLPGRQVLAGQLLRRCHRLLFVSGQLCERFAALLPRPLWRLHEERAVVLPMGVHAPAPASAAQRQAARRDLGLPDGRLGLFLGRLVPIKGLTDLLHAAQGIPSLTIVLAGGGPLEDELRGQARALGLDCRFPGWVAGPTKERLLQAADALLLPSLILGGRTEGLPVAAMEALAAGVPVLASATGGLPEAVWPGVNGLLVLPEEPSRRRQGWRAALQQLAAAPAAEWDRQRAGAARSGQGYRWEALGPRLVAELVPDDRAARRPPGGDRTRGA